MTWRLRFYDGDGVEVGYVEKPDKTTYNVVVTHPDSGWEDFKLNLQALSTLLVEQDYGMENPMWEADHGPMEYEWPPEEHLRKVQERFSHPNVIETTLKDE